MTQLATDKKVIFRPCSKRTGEKSNGTSVLPRELFGPKSH